MSHGSSEGIVWTSDLQYHHGQVGWVKKYSSLNEFDDEELWKPEALSAEMLHSTSLLV